MRIQRSNIGNKHNVISEGTSPSSSSSPPRWNFLYSTNLSITHRRLIPPRDEYVLKLPFARAERIVVHIKTEEHEFRYHLTKPLNPSWQESHVNSFSARFTDTSIDGKMKKKMTKQVLMLFSDLMTRPYYYHHDDDTWCGHCQQSG
jgi:hypothetical protein